VLRSINSTLDPSPHASVYSVVLCLQFSYKRTAEGEKYFLPLAKRIRGRPRGGPHSHPLPQKARRSFLKASIPLEKGTNVETPGCSLIREQLSLLNAVKIIGCADEELVAYCYRTRQRGAVQLADTQNLKRWSGFDNRRGPLFINAVDFAISQQR